MKVLNQFIVRLDGEYHLVFETNEPVNQSTGYGKYFIQEANGIILPISILEYPEINKLYLEFKK